MMKTKFRFYLLAALAGMLVLGSCEMDAWEINTTDIDGNWFVSKVELTDAVLLSHGTRYEGGWK